jgi:hypothetical protein
MILLKKFARPLFKQNLKSKIMKNLLLLTFICVLGFTQVKAQTSTAVAPGTETAPVNPNAPKAKYDKTTFDFGEIAQGVPKEAQFTLTNTGKEPLIISQAKAGCGCTNLKYSQEPVLPGKSTIIAATYNAAAVGPFTKSVTVTTNADPNPVMLLIKGTVLEKKQ